MSPSPNQIPQSSGSSDPAQTNEQPAIRRPNPPRSVPAPKSEATPKGDPLPKVAPSAKDQSSATLKGDSPPKVVPTAKDQSTAIPEVSQTETNGEAKSTDQDLSRLQPIPPPSEPMQYRAIGLVRGKYVPSEEQFTRGNLLATDGRQIDAVLLGRVMSLVKNHLDLATEHLWVVYPRTRQEQGDLHIQIVGVWEPEKLDKERLETESAALSPDSSKFQDGYFSIRGEVVFQMQDEQKIIVKIRQAARKENDKPKFFKLTLKGLLEKKAVGYFWDFQVKRDADTLVIEQAQDIASIRPRRPGKPRLGGKRFGGGGGVTKKPWNKNSRPQRPAGSTPGTSAAPPSGTKPVIHKPIPRPKPQPPSGEGGL